MNIAKAVAEAVHSMEMEGFTFTPEEKEMWRLIANGELPLSVAKEHAELFHRIMLAKFPDRYEREG